MNQCKRVSDALQGIVDGPYEETDRTSALLEFFRGTHDIIIARGLHEDTVRFSKWQLAKGKPDIWVDTEERAVTLRKGEKNHRYPIPQHVCDAIDALAEELDSY